MGVGMIVTTGKHIKIDVSKIELSRTAETPGLVTVRDRDGKTIGLPANKEEAGRFIEAFRRIVDEEVEYRKSEVE
jgi:hypothetical protein